MLTRDSERHARKVDGRFQRSERSKAAIVQALFELVGEGVPEPTADQVAERAGIGSRTVFRHFKDMETLYAELDSILEERYGPMMAAPVPECSIKERINEFVAQRARLYEGIAPYKRAGNIKRPHSEFLQARHAVLVRRLRKDLHHWFPEFKRKKPSVVSGAELLTSLEAWDRLRIDQRLGKKRAAEAMENALLALLRSS